MSKNEVLIFYYLNTFCVHVCLLYQKETFDLEYYYIFTCTQHEIVIHRKSRMVQKQHGLQNQAELQSQTHPCCCCFSVVSNSVQPHRRQPTRLPCPWDSQGKNTGVGCHFLLQSIRVKSESEVTQSCPTLSDPMDCSPPGSSIHGVFQARVLEWVLFCSLGKVYLHISVSFTMSNGNLIELFHGRGQYMNSCELCSVSLDIQQVLFMLVLPLFLQSLNNLCLFLNGNPGNSKPLLDIQFPIIHK